MYAHFDGMGLRFATLRDVNRQMDSVLKGFGWTAPTISGAGWQQTNDFWFVRAALPGAQPEQLEVACEEGRLVIRGRRELTVPEGYSLERRERRDLDFERRWTLPPTADALSISALYVDGILEVRVPKTDAATSRRVEVEVH